MPIIREELDADEHLCGAAYNALSTNNPTYTSLSR